MKKKIKLMSALKWTTKEVDQQLNYVVDVWEEVLRNLMLAEFETD